MTNCGTRAGSRSRCTDRDDAVPFGRPPADGALLPDWYMPVPGSIRRTRPRVVAVTAIIVSLIVVNGAGLCVTYGWPEIAW